MAYKNLVCNKLYHVCKWLEHLGLLSDGQNPVCKLWLKSQAYKLEPSNSSLQSTLQSYCSPMLLATTYHCDYQ